MYVVRFPDMTNVITFGFTHEHALEMAKDALEGVLECDIEHNHEIPQPKFKGGEPIEVSPRIAFALELRWARAGQTAEEVAEKCGMTTQQYERLENPRKTNPSLKTIITLQSVFGRKFLAV